MPSFSQKSMDQLTTCDYRLQRLFLDVVREFDCTVIQGHRSIQEQEHLFQTGKSKVRRGKHNESPSLAVDVAPWVAGRGIPWPHPQTPTYVKDLALFYYFAGYVMSRAAEQGILIRFGGDWDRDNNLIDQTFDDLVHFELL